MQTKNAGRSQNVEDLELEMVHFEQALDEIEKDAGGDARSGIATEAV